MTRQWVAALAMMLLVGLSSCAPQVVQEPDGAIRFAVDSTPFPPFAVPGASGKWTGFEVDLMEAVCAEMKAKCVIVPTQWDALIASLEARKIDVIWASMTVTEERRRVIDFSDVYYNTPMIMLAAKSSASIQHCPSRCKASGSPP